MGKYSEMHQTRLMIAYLSEAKATMLSWSQKNPDREDLKEGAYYIELLADSAIEKLRSTKPLEFKSRDLGL